MTKRLFYFAMVILFLSAASYTFAAPITVDSTDSVGKYPSSAIVSGKPAISYLDSTNGSLKYVRALDSSGTIWSSPVTVDTGGVGSHTSMIIVNNRPAISYYDHTHGNLKYVRAINSHGTTWLPPVTVDTGGTAYVGFYTSMAIVNGTPAITYYDHTHGNLKYVRAINSSGSAWFPPVTVDTGGAIGNVGQCPSITIALGRPAISYYDYTHKNLKYVRATNNIGSDWSTPVAVASAGKVGQYTSMAIINRHPAISYYDLTHGDLKYVRATNMYGGDWSSPIIVDSTDNLGRYTSLAIINGNPAISYYDETNCDLKYVRATNANGSAWSTPVIVDSAGRVGMYTSMLGINNNPAICYYDYTNKDLKFVRLSNLYFPHIASGSSWETEICIINTSAAEKLKGTIKAYGDAGNLVETKKVNLNSHGRKSIIIGYEFSKPADIGYIVFESDSVSVCGYTKFHISGKYRVAIPAVSKINAWDILVPHIASNDSWWTGLSLVNTRSSSKTLSIKFSNNTTKSITLAPNQHKKFSIASMFGNTVQPGIESAVISNTSGVIGLELFGSSPGSGENYLSGILLKDETSEYLCFPHVAGDATWWTGIVAYNPATSVAKLTIEPYTSNGSSLTTRTIDLPGKGKYVGTPGTLLLPGETAWFRISANQAITGFELFGTNNGKQLAGYTVINIDSSTGVFPKLEKDGWTGIAFVNPMPSDTTVRMQAYNNAGTLIANKSILLKKYGKKVEAAETLFGTSLTGATYITYSSTRPIVGFQLNGSTDSMLLDALPGK